MSKDLDFKWLEENVLLHTLAENERAALQERLKVREYQPGETIVSEGDKGGILHLLRAGRVEISQVNGDRKIHLNEAGEGAVFGEISFLTGNPANATVKVAEPAVVYQLCRADYCQLMISSPDIILSLFTHIIVHATSVISSMNLKYVRLN